MFRFIFVFSIFICTSISVFGKHPFSVSMLVDTTNQIEIEDLVHLDQKFRGFRIGSLFEKEDQINNLPDSAIIWIKIRANKETIDFDSEITLLTYQVESLYEAEGNTPPKLIESYDPIKGYPKVYRLAFSSLYDKDFYMKFRVKNFKTWMNFKNDLNLNFYRQKSRISILFGEGYILLLFAISIFILIQYYFSNALYILYYLLYLSSMVLFFFYFFITDSIVPYENYYSLKPSMPSWTCALMPIIVGLYLLYVQSLFRLSKKDSTASDYFKRSYLILSVSFVLICFGSFLIKEEKEALYFALTVITISSVLFFPLLSAIYYKVYEFWSSKDSFLRFNIVGFGILINGFLLSIIIHIVDQFYKEGDGFSGFIFNETSSPQNLYILKTFVLLEVFFFVTSFSFKGNQDAIRKEQQISNTKLSAQRTESNLQLQLAEAEQKALKAQMNPHFIYNSLTAFKLLIQEKQTDLAEEYIVKFSKLIRTVVEISQEPKTTLQKELAFCQLYLDMEQLRFDHTFEVSYHIDALIDTSFVDIPTFVLQPLLENAIWHGLILKEGLKKILILVRLKENAIECSIEDNGIGLEKAARNQSRQVHKKSVGLKNIRERLDLFKELYETEVLLSIQDKKNKDGSVLGVVAKVIIPQ